MLFLLNKKLFKLSILATCARNLVSDKNHGEIKGTTSWFPAPPKFEDWENKSED